MLLLNSLGKCIPRRLVERCEELPPLPMNLVLVGQARVVGTAGAAGRYRIAKNDEEIYCSPLTEVGVDVKEGTTCWPSTERTGWCG